MDKSIAKTILQAYGSLESVSEQIDRLVYASAVSTHSVRSDSAFCTAEKQIEKVVALMERKNRLIDLKLLTDEIIGCLNDVSKKVLTMKYIEKAAPEEFVDEFGISMRTYFRYLDRAETSFAKECEKRGCTDEWFSENYLNQNWLKYTHEQCKKQL